MGNEAVADPTLGSKPHFRGESGRGHVALSASFLLIYAALAAIGRDVFFNHNLFLRAEDDVIGHWLPYIRVAVCLFAVLTVTAASGLTWGLSKVPLLFAPYCVYALLSSAWSVDVKDTLRASLTLIASWVAMSMIIHRIGMVQAVRLSLILTAWVCIFSFLLAVFVPAIGRHNADDLIQAGHAGQWRGIFSHKNGLGPWAAYGATLILFYGDLMRAPPLFRWGSWACALACLIFANSVTSWLLALSCVVIVFAIKATRKVPALWLLIGGMIVVGGGAGIAVMQPDLLFAALGRDASLSGRRDIWQFATSAVLERPWFGYGYQTLGGADFLAREQMVFLQPIPGPESGYIDLLLEQGVIGFMLFFVPFVLAIRNGFAWLNDVQAEDRQAIGYFLTILLSTLVEGFSETSSLVPTGYDGIFCFVALFALLTAPKSPKHVRRERRQHARRWRPA